MNRSRPICVGHVPAITRAAGSADVHARGFRRAVCELLLAGYLGAQQGDAVAREWIASPSANRLAGLLGLPYWPPRPDQFYPLAELERRAALLTGPLGRRVDIP